MKRLKMNVIVEDRESFRYQISASNIALNYIRKHKFIDWGFSKSTKE